MHFSPNNKKLERAYFIYILLPNVNRGGKSHPNVKEPKCNVALPIEKCPQQREKIGGWEARKFDCWLVWTIFIFVVPHQFSQDIGKWPEILIGPISIVQAPP